jgi:ribosomal protein L40E
MRRFCAFSLFLCLILISACVPIQMVETEFRFKPNEVWDAQLRLIVTPAGVALLNANPGFLQSLLQQFNAQGLKSEVGKTFTDPEGNTVYPILFHGTGLATLNKAFFSEYPAFTKDPAQSSRIIFSLPNGTLQNLGLTAFNTTLTVRGGRIISSNGARINNFTTTWVNPTGSIEAVFEVEKDFTAIIILIALLIAGGIFLLVISRNAQKARYAAAYSTLPNKICMFCGSPIPTTAVFCPRCGKKN